jgi:hypothetical protein
LVLRGGALLNVGVEGADCFGSSARAVLAFIAATAAANTKQRTNVVVI